MIFKTPEKFLINFIIMLAFYTQMYVCSYKWIIVDTTYGVEHASSDVCKKVRTYKPAFVLYPVCIRIYVQMYMYICMYTYMHMHIPYVHINVQMYTYVNSYYVHMYIHMNFIKLCTNINAYTYICIYVYDYITIFLFRN